MGRPLAPSAWGALQHDLLQQACGLLDVNARWRARHVSQHWASLSEHIVWPQLTIPTTESEISSKVSALHRWRGMGKLQNCKINCLITEPMCLEDLPQLLGQFTWLAACSVTVSLLTRPDTDLLAISEMLAGHLAWLFNQHQFALRLCISKAPESSWIPPPDMLLALQDYICKFDMYSVSAQHPASSNITAPVSLHHLSALTHRSMSVLTCLVEVPLLVSIDEDAPADGSTSNSAISPVANMTGLTQLHLNAICDDLHLDFRTLGQLSLLQDLALQCFDFDVCCGAVLRSSRQSLRSIILTAMSWTAETYQRLHDVPFQQHLSISIAALDHAQALLLNGIQADVLKLVVHGNYGDDLPLVGLRLSLPQVHDLTLYRFSDVDPIDGLPLLPSLQRLTIVECHELTGRSVLTYPNVTQLTLVDCPSVSGAGLQHIVRIALPALKAISFHASEGQCSAMTPKLSLHALNALHFGQDLQLIDLRGVSELTYECVAKLQRACERKQRVRQSRVLLLLPSCIDQGEAELLLELEDHFILPNIIVSRLQCPLPLTDMIAESDTLSDMHHVLMM